MLIVDFFKHYGPLVALLVALPLWIAYDAYQAYDSDPNTDTASQYIKYWIRHHPISSVLFSTAIAAYLILHLFMQVI